MHENLNELRAARSGSQGDDLAEPPEAAPPTLDDIRNQHARRPVQPERELTELVGMCLWDVLSDNHEVRGPDGRLVDLGSFRAAAGFLAEMLNRELGQAPAAAEERERQMIEQMIGAADPLELLKRLTAEREAARARRWSPAGQT